MKFLNTWVQSGLTLSFKISHLYEDIISYDSAARKRGFSQTLQEGKRARHIILWIFWVPWFRQSSKVVTQFSPLRPRVLLHFTYVNAFNYYYF